MSTRCGLININGLTMFHTRRPRLHTTACEWPAGILSPNKRPYVLPWKNRNSSHSISKDLQTRKMLNKISPRESVPHLFKIFKLAFTALLFLPASSNAEALAEKQAWHDQRAVTADFSFSTLLEITDSDRSSVRVIRVFNRRSGALLQEIQVVDASAASQNPNEMVSIIDANFDGHPDFFVPFSDGGGGPNYTDNYYLFNSATGVFEIDPELSSLSETFFNPNGKISFSYRSGCCAHHGGTYRFIGKKLQLVADWDISLINGDWIETKTRRLKNGKSVTKNETAGTR